MTLAQYAAVAKERALYPKEPITVNPGLVYAALALAGEAGELANKVKKAIRSNTEPNPNVIADELGDVLWYVAAVADEIGVSLDVVAEMNTQKLRERAEGLSDRSIKG